MSEALREETAFFFDGRPQALALYLRLEKAVLARYADVRVKTQKTQISFVSHHLFACASLPRRKADLGALLVTFGLTRRLASPRVAVATEPYPNRWTHHVLVRAPEELDDELLRWLDEAYAFSMLK